LHIFLNCATVKKGTYTHADWPTLDPENRSTKLLVKKGFHKSFCFVADSFPRRVTLKRSDPWPRELWPKYKTNDDTLHSEYRKHGGEVTVIMGKMAQRAHKDIMEKENIDLELLYKTTGFEVSAEIVSSSKCKC
jgi:hypothetical protein